MTTHWILAASALMLLVACRHGVAAERADHLLLLETLPDGFRINRPTFLDVRTNFSGTVRVVESSEFRVVVNVSAVDLQAAYKVQAKLHAWNYGLLLQVSERDTSTAMVNLAWLAAALGWATLVTLVLTSLYAWYWYRSERSLYDLAERKSVAGSSVRGVYRSRNSLQVVNLPPLGDLPIPPPPPAPQPSAPHGDDADGLHNDDSLKQVPEMPEEEEAEAIEMEELTLLKLKDLDHHNDPTTNESDGHKVLTTQERNLIKNQFHAAQSSGKNVHKDMLKKDKPPKVPPKRRTANGLYTGVASGPESGSADESFDSENDTDLDLTGDSIRELSSTASEPNYENAQQQQPGRKPPMSSFMSPQRHPVRQGLVTTSTPISNLEVASKKGYTANKPDNLSRTPAHQDYHTDSSSSSSPGLLQQVMADVHKAGGGSGGGGSGSTPPPPQQAEFVKVTTPEKQSHPGGSTGLFPSEAPRPTLTTFSSPAQQPSGPPIGVKLSRAIRFKEPDNTSGGSSSSVTSADARQDFDGRPPPPPPVLPKYNAVDRYAPVQFPTTMGDIPEDPREDCESMRSGSIRSRSLYGSSEIFDAHNTNPEHASYYYNLADSDIDIPPLDAEDVLSDGGIPSPLTASLGRTQTTRDDSNVMMGQRFFGRGSPSATMGVSGSAPRPRPYSSIIVRGMDQRPTSDSGMSSPGMSSGTSTPLSSGVDSSSSAFLQQQQQHPLPPPPEVVEDTSQDGGSFSFPPPPTSSELQGPQPWNSGRSESSGGEYVTLPNNSSIKGAVYDTGSYKRPGGAGPSGGGRGGRRGGGGGGGRPGFGTTFTNLTLLTVISVLGLMTGGVCSKKTSSYDDADDETKVDITIFAPPSFLAAKRGTVYFNLEKDTALDVEGNFDFEAFVPNNPVLRESRPELCYNNKCEHGCDVQTGQCMCHKGYRPIDDKHCIDVNECAEGFTNCHPSAGCLNRKGSYDCVCSVDYYGDGKTCHDCSTPCRDDQYEVQACSKTSQKICQECTKVCHNGYYMATQCTPITNAVCRVCQPPCLAGQYEYRTCSNYHDRQCKDVGLLPDVAASNNIILEDDRKVKESEVIIEHLRSLSLGSSPYTLTRDCDMPCRENEYELQPCSRMMKKICKECIETCPTGYYMAIPCQSPVADAVCRVCRPPCPEGQYEFKPCSNEHDRGCRDEKLRPDGIDSIKAKESKDSKGTRENLRTPSIRYMRYSLKRGTGLHVDIQIQDMEAAQQFQPMVMPDLNISDSSPAALQSNSVQRFCPHPVPDHYILHYTKHPDVTYLLDNKGNVKPCHTYKDHGKFPTEASKKDNSFLCQEPGSLTKLFEIPPETFQTTTVWVEKSKRCANYSTKCEQCTRKCAQSMTTDPDCKIIGDNNDNGWSPRLRVCYNCCARNNCASDCQDYHRRRRCQPLKCQRGNLVDFTIFPVWNSNQNGKFFCHIQPVARQRLLEMTYTVRSDARKDPVHTAMIRVDGGEEWEKHGHTIHKDKLLDILVDSHLGQMPDFMEGGISSGKNEFLVGNYIKEGSRVETTVVGAETLRIHPLKPFGVRFSKADPQKCENDILKESLIASEHQTPYKPNHNLMAVAFHNKSSPFIITHTRQPPTIKIRADKRSFLKRIFSHATLRPGVLTGRMKQNATHWIVEMMGSVQECPGYLKVVLSDPAYPNTPLFSCDVAVTCPPSFHLHFYLPTGDSPGLDRQVVVSVADAKQVHHLRLHRPSKDDALERAEGPPPTSTVAMQTPTPLKQKEVSKVSLPEGFIFSIPFMVSVGGAVFLLLCLLIIGLIVQPGVPAPEPPILRCHHALFMVIYIVFQFIYSVVATSSVFFLVVIAINSPRVAFIQQHQYQAAATSASHHLELTAMQTFLEKEIQRQDDHMDSVQSVCRKDMDIIIADMKEVHKKVLRETEDVFHKHDLVMLLEDHRHHSMLQLSQDLLSFRNKYSQAVQTILLELNHNIQQAQQSIENSTWLAGARHLHAIVTSTRKHIEFVDTKPFMEWAHLQSDLSKLTVDVSFSLPSLPRLADIEKAMEAESTKKDPQPTKRSKDNRQAGDAARTTHTYNQWFSPFPHNASFVQYTTLGGSFGGEDGGDWRKEGDSFVVFYIILGLLGGLDLILVLHRMLKAKTVGQLLLYGFPEYMDFRERKDEGDDDVFSENTRCRCWSDSLFCQAVKAFVTQLISSTFLPKAVMVVAVALMIRGVLHISSTTLTVQSLHKAGLYHSSEEYLELHSQLINGRLKAHAHHINTIDFPAFQTWMSTVIQRHQFAFQVYQQQLQHMQRVHTQSYCQYLQTLDLTGNCSSSSQGDSSQDDNITYGIISPGCQFQPVLTKFYKRSESEYRNLSEQQLSVVLENLRAIIFDTCQIIIVFVSIIVLKELICAVVWIFIRRSGLIRLRIIYETDQDEPGPTG